MLLKREKNAHLLGRDMAPEKHIVGLGNILVNLHAIEFAARAYFLNLEKADLSLVLPKKLDDLRVGDEVPVNGFTNGDSLKPMLRRYNEQVRTELQVDTSIVDLRDALAHGRVSGNSEKFPLRLLKFKKTTNRNSKVTLVTHSELLDEVWFERQIARLETEANKIARAIRELPTR